jgi:hypothetical protein
MKNYKNNPMKTNKLFVLIFFLITGLSCKKESAAQPEFSCDKTAKITRQTFGPLGMIIEYANGKISKVYRADGTGLTENYNYKSVTELEITRKFTDGSVGNLFNATLNDKGYITKFVQVSQVAPYTINYTYNAEGNQLTSQAVYPMDVNQNSNTIATYSAGNILQKKTLQKNVVLYTEDFTYYDDKLSKADYFANQNRPDLYGKFSKNLIKTYKITYPDAKADLYEYTYEVNSNGFITSATEKYTDKTGKITSQVQKFEYACL